MGWKKRPIPKTVLLVVQGTAARVHTAAMITRIWGPCAWRIYHGLSHVSGVRVAPLVQDFVHLMGVVMPCKYCRESYVQFVDEMTARQSLHSVVADGNFAEWCYYLHERVNNKLHDQHYAAAHVSPHCAKVLHDRCQLKFDTLQKRMALQRPYFSASDVHVFLGAVAYNVFGDAAADVDEDRAAAVFEFMSVLGQLMVEAGTHEAMGHDLHREAHAVLTTLTPKDMTRIHPVTVLVRLQEPWLQGARFRAQVASQLELLKTMKASTCGAGVCH